MNLCDPQSRQLAQEEQINIYDVYKRNKYDELFYYGILPSSMCGRPTSQHPERV